VRVEREFRGGERSEEGRVVGVGVVVDVGLAVTMRTFAGSGASPPWLSLAAKLMVSRDLPRPGSPASTVSACNGTRPGHSQSTGLASISAALIKRARRVLRWEEVEASLRLVAPGRGMPATEMSLAVDVDIAFLLLWF
jgi:hypothetical protein